MATRVCPELPVGDVEAATEWYRSVLGAMPVWRWQDELAAVRLGDVELYLLRARNRRPASVYLHVEDATAIHGRVVGIIGGEASPGGSVTSPLGDREWGMREFTVADPWGNRLRVGQPLRLVHETPGYTAHEHDPRVP
jgi:catechol 2,3-dioxygenase-like lactoylglutathione lyase family enzyme